MNQVFGTFYANGHGTIVPDALFVDAQSTITQSTVLPGFGFQNLSTLPRNQQTQQFINNVTPYVVKSFDGLVDTELRYTFSSSNYGGNTAIVTSPVVPGQNNLSSGTLNEGTFIAATGQDFERMLARFTADASEYNSTSTAQNTQASIFNDFEYRFTPIIAALGRAGYQNQRFPLSPAASFAGATWLVGGRVGTAGPDQPAFASLEYGKQQSVYGFYNEQQSLTLPVTAPTKSLDINFGYSRDIRPDLSGYASIGYVNSVNSPTVSLASSTPNFNTTANFNTTTANLALNYILGRTLTGSIIYTFSYQSNGSVLVNGRNGDVFANQLQFLLSKTF